MLDLTRRRAGELAVLTLVAGAIAAPAVNGASNRTVDSTAKVKGLPSFTGTVSGKPYGSGKVRGELNLPRLTATLTYSGGKVRISGKITNASDLRGTWKTTGGTGRYRSVSGSGTFTGSLKGTSATLRFRGRVKG
ncbi:MAG: hypothetical protein JHC95_22570 [Solirubrobacteraceae bacterium]|nr:hypothetical protein [Solirubrobacteraceae bacterium]